jgi:small-conductance mechanosensitive channel
LNVIFEKWYQDLTALLTAQALINLLNALIIIVVGIFVARRVRAGFEKLTQLDTQQRLLVTKISYYGIIIVAVAASFSQLGIDLRVILGAAGILTVAVGFAAQTSASNLISGIFLMIERPFVVGDVISIGDVRGEVLSIDLLSSKIRTFNNLMVRIPNEKLVKSDITNFSYFPIRRVDFDIGIAYDSNLTVVENALRKVATVHPLCLEDPQPVFMFAGFGESSMNIQFQVWTLSSNLRKLQNELYRDIKIEFDQVGISIPFPTRTLITTGPHAAPEPGPSQPPPSHLS